MFRHKTKLELKYLEIKKLYKQGKLILTKPELDHMNNVLSRYGK